MWVSYVNEKLFGRVVVSEFSVASHMLECVKYGLYVLGEPLTSHRRYLYINQGQICHATVMGQYPRVMRML